MNGFYATNPATPTPDIVVDNFYPAVSVDNFRQQYRVDDSYSPEAVQVALFEALVDVTDDLQVCCEQHQTDGYNTLADVPSRKMNNQSRLLILFEQAVYCTTKAALIGTFRDADTARNLGEKRSTDHELSGDYWQKRGRYAINKLLDKPTVEAKLL